MTRGVSKEGNTKKNHKFMQQEVKGQKKRASLRNSASKSPLKAINKNNRIGSSNSDKKEASIQGAVGENIVEIAQATKDLVIGQHQPGAGKNAGGYETLKVCWCFFRFVFGSVKFQ
ncbi:hypothetical protein Peur_065781 [Populus x canadensis]